MEHFKTNRKKQEFYMVLDLEKTATQKGQVCGDVSKNLATQDAELILKIP